MTEINYKIHCINLKRRQDRRIRMESLFQKNSVTNYTFFDAIDGESIDLNYPDLKYFRHGNTAMHRKGIVGCALSHIALWKKLLEDEEVDYYVILEDDINLCHHFQEKLDLIVKQISDTMDFIYLGMTIEGKNIHKCSHMYIHNDTYTIHPHRDIFCGGGFFGYIISKQCCQKFINYIEKKGLKLAIDHLVIACFPIDLYDTHPFLVFTDSVQHAGYNVDSDIQTNYNKIDIFQKKMNNNYLFDDYIFYPNLDSSGNDLFCAYGNIESIKKIADSMEECIAFNTYGWIKYAVQDINKFSALPNSYHHGDGLYVKKNHNKTFFLEKKKKEFNRKIECNNPKIFIGTNADRYSSDIVTYILSFFNNPFKVNTIDTADIIIYHSLDNQNINHTSINILISSSTKLSDIWYDITIDCKPKSNSTISIYYPYLFRNYFPNKNHTEKTKFCLDICNNNALVHGKIVSTIKKYKKIDSDSQSDLEEKTDDLISLYSSYKFAIILDDCICDGYIGHKLSCALLSNCIPIYWGSNTIFDTINSSKILYIPDYESIDELLSTIQFLDTHNDAYQNIINLPLLNKADPEKYELIFRQEIKNLVS